MHPIDRASGWLLRFGPARLRYFHDGWGDRDELERLRAAAASLDDVLELDLEWGHPRSQLGTMVRDATFQSPVAWLPDGAGTGHVRVVVPEDGTERLCLLMAAWNDHRYDTRLALAQRLARSGIGSVLLENPYYGRRRPRGAREDRPIATVVDFLAMGRAAVQEGRALLAHFRSDYTMGVSGYSMGGNIAGLVSATVPFPVATAPLAPAHSPAPVFVEGVLRRGVDWAALATIPDPKDELFSVMRSASVLNVDPPDHARHAVLVGGSSDGYIPRHAVVDFHAHWPGSELRWVRAGHATLLWTHKPALVAAIADSFERLP